MAVKGKTSLKEISQGLNLDYDDLKRLNPHVNPEIIRNGEYVLLAVKKNEAEQEDASAQETQQTEKSKQEKITQYKQNIAQAQSEYQSDKKEAFGEHAQKTSKLAEALRKSKQKLEGDLASRKITSSSIASNQRQAFQNESIALQQELDENLNKKVKKLADKLNTSVAKQKQKIEALD